MLTTDHCLAVTDLNTVRHPLGNHLQKEHFALVATLTDLNVSDTSMLQAETNMCLSVSLRCLCHVHVAAWDGQATALRNACSVQLPRTICL